VAPAGAAASRYDRIRSSGECSVSGRSSGGAAAWPAGAAGSSSTRRATAAAARVVAAAAAAGMAGGGASGDGGAFGIAWPAPVARLAADAARHSGLLARCAVTLLMLITIRAGHFIPLPGVDLSLVPTDAGGAEGLMGAEGGRMMRALYGQARELPASIFDLGIGPWINAQIIVTVLLSLPKDLLPFEWAERLREARKARARPLLLLPACGLRPPAAAPRPPPLPRAS